MLQHRLGRGALHLAQERLQRGRLDFYHELLGNSLWSLCFC